MNPFLKNIALGIAKPVLRFMAEQRLAELNGRLSLSGLQQTVQIRRDQWGIPHIVAANQHDMFFAQGVVHAQDRLWQMALNRQIASGRLAEWLGEVALPLDRLTRTLGFRRLAEAAWGQMGDQVQADMTAYVAGINSYLDTLDQWPIEMRLLGIEIEPWHVLDCMTIGRLQSWSMSRGWSHELARARLLAKLPAELYAEIDPRYWESNPATLPQGIELNDLILGAAVDTLLSGSASLGKGGAAGLGSNGWVIAPERSTSGHALLANDTHLPLTTPSIWYFLHMRATDPVAPYHCAGGSIPGTPYVVVGHNDQISWGITLSYADCEDLVVERLDETGKLYQFGESWRPLQIVEEVIRVKGAADHIEAVKITHHGPVVSQVLPSNQQVLSLQATSLQDNKLFRGIAGLGRAADWCRFLDAIHEIESPSLNILYADTAGNIGYALTGHVPIRTEGDGRIPALGYTGTQEWSGFIPIDEMPRALNPEQGYIVSCNHKIVPDDFPYDLGDGWFNGWRAKRLVDLIEGQEKISADDCARWQRDFVSLPGQALQARLADFETADPQAQMSWELFRDWDGELGVESVGGTVYQVFTRLLSEAILRPLLGEALFTDLLGAGPHPVLYPISEFYGRWSVTLLRLLDDPTSRWLPSGETGRRALFTRCFAETTGWLSDHLDKNPQKWHWGRLHQVRFPHALGQQEILDPIFSHGPYPIGGDTDTVTQTASLPIVSAAGHVYEHNGVSPSFLQVIDMGDMAHARAMAPPGQSGQLGSIHYGDLIELWLAGDYFPVLWTDEQIAQAWRSELTLVKK